jgi:mRNA interferase YafQ
MGKQGADGSKADEGVAVQKEAELSAKDIQRTSRFKKDYKRVKSRGLDMSLLKTTIVTLQNGEELDASYRNHQLEGKWKDSFDCHIQPDWILVYRTTDDSVILQATGTHSDLFKK